MNNTQVYQRIALAHSPDLAGMERVAIDRLADEVLAAWRDTRGALQTGLHPRSGSEHR